MWSLQITSFEPHANLCSCVTTYDHKHDNSMSVPFNGPLIVDRVTVSYTDNFEKSLHLVSVQLAKAVHWTRVHYGYWHSDAPPRNDYRNVSIRAWNHCQRLHLPDHVGEWFKLIVKCLCLDTKISDYTVFTVLFKGLLCNRNSNLSLFLQKALSPYRGMS